MNRKPLETLPQNLPQEFLPLLSGCALFDCSSSPEAAVYFADRGDGFYLKRAKRGALQREAEMTDFFHSKGFCAEVLRYLSAEEDWLLTAAVPGADCTHPQLLQQPQRLCDTLAETLRALHETDPAGCPVPNRTAEYLALAEQNYRAGLFDSSLLAEPFRFRSAEEAHAVLAAEASALQSRVLLHGDYCLPNVILKNWRLSGFVDVDHGGVGDRHIDLFWGIWSLQRNLNTDRFNSRFLDAYGRDKADPLLLRVVAAAEVFG